MSRVLHAHTIHDAALLTLESGSAPTEGLPLDGSGNLRPHERVYVVGYPGADARRNDPIDVQAVFQGIFG